MIGEVLNYLRLHLDATLRAALGDDPDDPGSDRVVFVDSDKVDPITFKLGAVTLLLVSVEEERLLRAADPYSRVLESGETARVQPDIRLSLHLLFVARLKQYNTSWDNLSKIIEHLQTSRVLERAGAPDLPQGVERLVFELVTQSFAEQNEVWSALRTAHLPSILYRVRLIAFRDKAPTSVPKLTTPIVKVNPIP